MWLWDYIMLVRQRQAVRRNVRVPVVYLGIGESPNEYSHMCVSFATFCLSPPFEQKQQQERGYSITRRESAILINSVTSQKIQLNSISERIIDYMCVSALWDR